MNVLLVDDQRAVVESLKKGICWEHLEVEQVFTTSSAKEAKLILRNFPVDILVTDIEMPEEDDLRWHDGPKKNSRIWSAFFSLPMRNFSMPERQFKWEVLTIFCSLPDMRMWSIPSPKPLRGWRSI